MEPLSYQFVVTREGGFPALGLLRDWAGGNEAALRHLERVYPDWTQITIQKISEPTTKLSRQRRDLRGLRNGSRCDQGVCSFA